MFINKWSPPAGGTVRVGTLRRLCSQLTYTPMRGVGGGSRDGGLLFAQNYNFLFWTLNSPSIVVVLGKVALGRRKNIMYLLCSHAALRKTEILNYNRFRERCINQQTA